MESARARIRTDTSFLTDNPSSDRIVDRVAAFQGEISMDTKLVALFAMAVSLAGCSKAVVTMPARAIVQQPMSGAPVAAIQAPAKSQSDRMVEIDRMLSAPLTGSPEDADRRSSLRAERAALIASGNYAPQADQPARQSNSEIVSRERDADTDFVNYAPPPPSNGQIVVAVDSQGRSGYLPFLEGMTPSERLHYFQALWLQNSQNINVTRNSDFTRGRFRRSASRFRSVARR